MLTEVLQAPKQIGQVVQRRGVVRMGLDETKNAGVEVKRNACALHLVRRVMERKQCTQAVVVTMQSVIGQLAVDHQLVRAGLELQLPLHTAVVEQGVCGCGHVCREGKGCRGVLQYRLGPHREAVDHLAVLSGRAGKPARLDVGAG